MSVCSSAFRVHLPPIGKSFSLMGGLWRRVLLLRPQTQHTVLIRIMGRDTSKTPPPFGSSFSLPPRCEGVLSLSLFNNIKHTYLWTSPVLWINCVHGMRIGWDAKVGNSDLKFCAFGHCRDDTCAPLWSSALIGRRPFGSVVVFYLNNGLSKAVS